MIDMGQSLKWRIELADEKATHAFAQDIASYVQAGDLVTLSGDLGAGKTTLARALIRVLVGDETLEVPSPTFTLIQIYEAAFPIVHADLYRINNPDELEQLGWDEAAEGALVLVEWAERAGDQLPFDRLDLAFHLDATRDAQFRTVTMTAYGTMVERVKRARSLSDLLARAGWQDAERHFMQGDASTRAYERLIKPDGQRAVLMISPPRPDGPPVRQGKPYSAIARLAENMGAFIAVDRELERQGLSVPKIYACDLDYGLAVLEDLGADVFVDEQGPIADRYAEAVALLADLHGKTIPKSVPLESSTYDIPPYDIDALMIEVELLTEWYVPHIAKVDLSSAARATFSNLWRTLLEPIAHGPASWTLRDYHSPNLIWLADREGLNRVGVLDFQDCVLGHPAYDVASLLQDARVTVSDELELRLLTHYARARRAALPDFNMAKFAEAYALFAAQRATKILGIFARLDKRDQKPHYLAHLPRVERYLAKNMAHPIFADLKHWYATYLPQVELEISADT